MCCFCFSEAIRVLREKKRAPYWNEVIKIELGLYGFVVEDNKKVLCVGIEEEKKNDAGKLNEHVIIIRS